MTITAGECINKSMCACVSGGRTGETTEFCVRENVVLLDRVIVLAEIIFLFIGRVCGCGTVRFSSSRSLRTNLILHNPSEFSAESAGSHSRFEWECM